MPVKVTNTSGTGQGFSGQWLKPGETKEIPFPLALHHRASPDLSFDWSNANDDLTPSIVDNELVGLTFKTPLSHYDGYGLVGYLITRELAKRVDLDLYTGHPLNIHGPEEEIYRDHLNRKKELWTHAIALGLPEYWTDIPCAKLIGYSMWEVDRLPQSWIPNLKKADLCLVPSKENLRSYRRMGLERVELLPCPIDIDFWTAGTKEPPDKPFTFVTWGKLSGRKMPIEIIDCFTRAFPINKYPDVRLELKTTNTLLGMGRGMIPNFDDKRIIVHDGNWPLEQLRDWAANAHVGIFLSHGEGQFNPPMQTMALGLPTIAPNHSGPADYVGKTWCYPIQLDERMPVSPAPAGTTYEGALWWNPDLKQTIATMREIYYNYKEAKLRAKKAPAMLRKRFSPEVVVDQLLEYVKAL